MHIKRIHEMTEYLTEYGKCMIESGVNGKNVNICDAEKVIDMIKDLCEAEHHARLAKCLEKDEETGEQEKRTAEIMRDIDRVSRNRLYFTEPMKEDNKKHEESKLERAKRMYAEAKELHADNTPDAKQAKMQKLDEYARELSNEITEIMDDTTVEEHTLMKNKLQTLLQKL